MISYHPDQKNIGKKECYFYDFHPIPIDDPHRIAKALTSFVVSPCMFKEGRDKYGRLRNWYRHTACFVQANWIGLDFDEGPTLAEMTRAFCDVVHVIGTTKSHQIPKGAIKHVCDRFRIFLKLPQTITKADEYKDILRFYVDRYDADNKCVDAARFFWPCKTITSVCDDGDTIDIRKKEIPKVSTYDIQSYREIKSVPPFIRHWLEFGVPQGEKNDVCFKIGIWLTKAGFSHAEIVSLVMASAIPNRHDRVEIEVYNTTLNGVRVALRELKTPALTGADKNNQPSPGT